MLRVKRYKNLSGNSGVAAYESEDSLIKVRFHGNSDIYVYDSRRPGRARVAHMKELAESGRGLSTYISQVVKDDFARRKPS